MTSRRRICTSGIITEIYRIPRVAAPVKDNEAMGIRFCLAMACLIASAAHGQSADAAEWIPLFDGTTLAGWQESEFRGKGSVAVKDGTIVIGKARLTGIRWAKPFPKTGYEIRFEAARLEGEDFFAGITFPVGDTHCSWINGGWGGSVVGLSSLDGDDASENDTSTVRDFAKGQWYAFRLLVEPDRIQGWIDGVLVIDADIKGRKVGLRGDEMELSTPLGFASYKTVAGLRNIAYRPLNGNSRP
jgi:hypothetical protein